MAYQLRSRRDPVTTESQEQTDIPEEYLTELQVTTPSHVEFISSQLSTIQSVAATTAEANCALITSDMSTNPDVETHPPLDIQGPTRPDPDLDSAPSTASPSSTGIHLTTQQLAPAQASASISAQFSLAEEVGPPSSVIASCDYIPTTNQTQQLHDTIDSLLLLSQHDSKEVKHNTSRYNNSHINFSQQCDVMTFLVQFTHIITVSLLGVCFGDFFCLLKAVYYDVSYIYTNTTFSLLKLISSALCAIHCC